MNLQQENWSYNNEGPLYLQSQNYSFIQDLLFELRRVCFTHFLFTTLKRLTRAHANFRSDTCSDARMYNFTPQINIHNISDTNGNGYTVDLQSSSPTAEIQFLFTISESCYFITCWHMADATFKGMYN